MKGKETMLKDFVNLGERLVHDIHKDALPPLGYRIYSGPIKWVIHLAPNGRPV